MASQRKILRSAGDVVLFEETTDIFIPELRINTAYVVASRRIPNGAYFDDLHAAIEEFEREAARSATDSSMG